MKKKSDTVRYTRAGDQFHYRLAARRCLGLLNPQSKLICITVEGISPDEAHAENIGTGEEVVDVAEYYGSREIKYARKISYHQLKHSYQGDYPWTLSALKKTLEGFFKRFEIWKKEVEDPNSQEIDFTYTTNRPTAQSVHDLVSRIRSRSLTSKDKNNWDQIKRYLGAPNDDLAYEFFSSFRIDDTHDIHWKQRSILIEDMRGYMPGGDSEAVDQLWRLVVDKISPEFSANPEITREDVLRYLNTNQDELYPAPSLIKSEENYFVREQESEFITAILNNDGNPIVIHAEGGVGKTAIANRLINRMPDGSLAIVYDCFGNGSYRNPTQRRDEHCVGLVQIANELASLGLCHPLIPSRLAKPSDYLKAFSYRLEQSIKVLHADSPDAKLAILIDAADNAQMAAEEYQERASFAKDLIREKLPERVVSVFFCRSHRIQKLTPPHGYVNLKLRAFSECETRALLTRQFPNASDSDVQEFHRLSTQNPRVQATALSRGYGLQETITLLGPEPSSIEDTIRELFKEAIEKYLDSVPENEASQISALCESLAALRPFVPIEILSDVSGLDVSAITSFATDLGRPLSIIGGAIQFHDEPSETWFRETYKPQNYKLIEFVNTLKSLVATSSYAASALPQLMLEAGLYDDLVSWALVDADTHGENAVDKRNASLQRLQFALKAALRNRRYDDAVKLALKAGGETAGSDRQEALIQGNTDLISRLLPAHRIREIIAQKSFSSSWHGGHHAYEACLLSGNNETLPEARSYLRLAHRWVQNWSRLPNEKRKDEEIQFADIAEMAMCRLYLSGAQDFVNELESWKPRSVAFNVSSIVLRRLIDLQEYNRIDQIAQCSKENLCVLLAVISEQSPICRFPNQKYVRIAIEGLKNFPRQIKKQSPGYSYEEPLLTVVNSVAQAAIVKKAAKRSVIADVLDIYIPSPENYYFSDFSDEPRFTILRANCIRAALRNKEVELADFAKLDVRQQLQKGNHSHSDEVRKLREGVGPVLPWHKLWTQAVLKKIEANDLDRAIDKCLKEFRNEDYSGYRGNRPVTKEIARLWIEILLLFGPIGTRMNRFNQWKSSLKQKLSTPTLSNIAYLCARTEGCSDQAFALAQEAFDIVDQERADAEEKVDSYILLSRATYAADVKEAEHYLEKAVEVAGRIGDENLDRWSSLLELVNVAANNSKSCPETSYRVARAAEVVYEFVARDKYFDWEGTVDAIAKLCPSSSLTILSRWRDRSFGWVNRLVPHAVIQLTDSKRMSPTTALALIGFQYEWKSFDLLENAIKDTDDSIMRKKLFDCAVRYLEVRGATSEDWNRMAEIASYNSWIRPDLQCRGHISANEEKREQKRNNGSLRDYTPEPDPPKDWDQIFAEMNVAEPESIQNSHRQMWNGEPPYHTELFATEFFRRVPKNKESIALEAIFSISDFSLYDIRRIYETIPEAWLNRNYIQSALRAITKQVCKAHFYEIAKLRYWQPLPYEVIFKCSGVTESEIYHWVLDACAENPIILGSSRLFSLVGLIAPSLTPKQAESALDYGLTLLESNMTDDDGDGEWVQHLYPLSEVSASCAGYTWTALASPDTAERWQAAHVVCLLCAFDEQEVLDHLSLFADGRSPKPFHDASLPFYVKSANLWLLFALQRALALGYMEAVGRFKEFLITSCSPTVNHVILRSVSAKILLGLHTRSVVALSDTEVERLQHINAAKQETVISNTYNRQLVVLTPEPISEDDKYYFGYDMSRYWFESLGRIFSFEAKEIENRACKLLRDEWDVFGKGNWRADPRHKRGLYGERETYHSHGSYPQAEDLSFYHSYHSMMSVAGELIDTATRYQESDYDDEFEEWINRHQITRDDGFWLADRRDPKQTEEASWKSAEEDDEWRYSVRKDDLIHALAADEGDLSVWGTWNFADGDREERIRISSALVSSETSIFLLRALQTTTNPSDYGVPSSGDELEIESGQYKLKGWIQETSREYGLDEYDPWAGDIGYPPLRPAKWFVEKFHLDSDYEQRTWQATGFDNQPVLKSSVWGRKSDRHDYVTPETGSRLVASQEAVKYWLTSLSMDLIIEIQINREFKRDSYRNKEAGSPKYLPPNTLLVLFKSDGKIETI